MGEYVNGVPLLLSSGTLIKSRASMHEGVSDGSKTLRHLCIIAGLIMDSFLLSIVPDETPDNHANKINCYQSPGRLQLPEPRSDSCYDIRQHTSSMSFA